MIAFDSQDDRKEELEKFNTPLIKSLNKSVNKELSVKLS